MFLWKLQLKNTSLHKNSKVSKQYVTRSIGQGRQFHTLHFVLAQTKLINFFFKHVDARKFGYYVSVLHLSYILRGRGKKKNSIGWGREFQTYVAFRFGAKKKKRTFRDNQQSCCSKNLDRILLCSPQHKTFGNQFLRPQLTFAYSHGFGHTPGTTQSPSPLGQNLDNEFWRENLLISQKFVGRQLKNFLFQFLLLMHPFILRSSFV